MPTLPQLSVVDAKGAIDRREISCLEYVQALVDQHAKTELLNGFVFFDRDALLQAAREHDESLIARTGRLPLSGIPLAIKDNIDCAGMPTAAGTAALRDAVPRADAPVVARVIDAGAWPPAKPTCTNSLSAAPATTDFSARPATRMTRPEFQAEAAAGLPCWWRVVRCRRRSAPTRADRCAYRRRCVDWSAFVRRTDAIRPGVSCRYRPRVTRSARSPAPSPT